MRNTIWDIEEYLIIKGSILYKAQYSFWYLLVHPYNGLLFSTKTYRHELSSHEKTWQKCYELNAYVSPKFVCWNTNLRCNGIWRWVFWGYIRLDDIRRWGPHAGISALLRRDAKKLTFSFCLCTMWGQNAWLQARKIACIRIQPS